MEVTITTEVTAEAKIITAVTEPVGAVQWVMEPVGDRMEIARDQIEEAGKCAEGVAVGLVGAELLDLDLISISRDLAQL